MTDVRTALTALISEHSALSGPRAERLAERIAAEFRSTRVVGPRWSPLLDNCNEPYHFARWSYVRCTAVEHHHGLHRCHIQLWDRVAVLMWGDDNDAVSLESLAATPNPLALMAPDADTDARVVSERDKAREECGYEKRLRANTRESESLFIRLKKEREAERDALAATIQRVEALCDEWQHGENSATKVEPGIAYCARELRHVLGRQYEPGQPGYDPALDGPGEEDG